MDLPRVEHRPRILGGVLLVAALGLALGLPYYVAWKWSAALALAVAGTTLLVVLWEPAVPASALEASVAGGQRSLLDLLDDLGLTGHAVVVPGGEGTNLREPRLFVPAGAVAPLETGAPPVPVLDDATGLYAAGGDASAGVAVTPPGWPLLAAFEAEEGASLQGASLPEATALLQGLGLAHDLYGGLNVTREGDGYRVRYRPHVATPCQRGDACLRAPCLACSVVLTGLARALRRPLLVRRIGREGGAVTLHVGEAA